MPGKSVRRFGCDWPTTTAVVALAAAAVALVWLSPSLRMVAGPVEIVHVQPTPCAPTEPPP